MLIKFSHRRGSETLAPGRDRAMVSEEFSFLLPHAFSVYPYFAGEGAKLEEQLFCPSLQTREIKTLKGWVHCSESQRL